MNVKGDAPYDFTCESGHRCPKCSKIFNSIYNETKRRTVTIDINKGIKN